MKAAIVNENCDPNVQDRRLGNQTSIVAHTGSGSGSVVPPAGCSVCLGVSPLLLAALGMGVSSLLLAALGLGVSPLLLAALGLGVSSLRSGSGSVVPPAGRSGSGSVVPPAGRSGSGSVALPAGRSGSGSVIPPAGCSGNVTESVIHGSNTLGSIHYRRKVINPFSVLIGYVDYY